MTLIFKAASWREVKTLATRLAQMAPMLGAPPLTHHQALLAAAQLLGHVDVHAAKQHHTATPLAPSAGTPLPRGEGVPDLVYLDDWGFIPPDLPGCLVGLPKVDSTGTVWLASQDDQGIEGGMDADDPQPREGSILAGCRAMNLLPSLPVNPRGR